MPVTVADLQVKFSSDTRQFEAGASRVQRSISGLAGFAKSTLSTAFGVALGGSISNLTGTVTGFAKSLIFANAQAEQAKLALETVTGSARRAEEIFKNLQQFAAKTPFEFPELMQATINLEAFGLSSEKWLTTIGDTAAAMGKSVDQVTQAVLDATTGEFERLKELGIKTIQEGGKTYFQYQKNGETIRREIDRNNAAMIESTLQAIWNEKYAGAMRKQSKSFIGQWSTLRDNIRLRMQQAAAGVFEFAKRGLGAANHFFESWDRARAAGFSPTEALFKALRSTILDTFGRETLARVRGTLDSLQRGFEAAARAGRLMASIAGAAFRFLGRHLDIVVPAVAGFVGALAAIAAGSAAVAVVTGLAAAVAALLGPVTLVAAAVALFAVAYSKNWLGIRTITNRVVGAIARILARLVAILRGGTGLRAAIADLPAPLQKLAILLRRVAAIGGNFLAAWRRGGPIAAFRALSRDIEKIGRTLGNVFKSIGLGRFGDHVAQLFRQMGQVIRDVVKLVDDLVHGRWSAAWRDLQRLAKDAFELFLTWLRGAPAILRDLLDLALRAIRAVDWGGVASWLLEQGGRLLRGLYDGAVGFLTGTLIPWLGGILPQVPGWIGDAAGWLWDTGTALLGGLWDGIRHIWDTKLKDFFSRLPGKIAGLFPDDTASRLLGTGKTILGGLWDGITSVWEDVVRPFFSGIVDRVVGAMPSVMNLLSPLINAGKSILNGIWNGVTWVWDNVVKPFFSGIANTVFEAIPGWDTILSVLKPAGENLINAVWEGIKAAWAAVEGFFAAVPEKVASALRELGKLKGVLEGIKAVADAVWSKIEDIAGWVGGKLGIGGGGGGDGSADGQQPAIPGLAVVPFSGEGTLEEIRRWVSDVQTEFAKLSPWLIPAATGTGAVGDVATMTPASFDGSTVLTSIQTFVASVTTEFETMKSGIWELLGLMAIDVDIQFGVAKAHAIDRTFDLARGVENELIGLRGSARTLAEGVKNAIIDGFDNLSQTLTRGEGAFVVLRLDIVAALNRTATEAAGAAAGIRRAIIAEFSNLYVKGYEIGSNLGSGINNGIAAWTNTIATTAANAVTQAIQAAKRAAGVASPSRVMAALGEDLMAGLAIGIDRARGRATTAMTTAMQATTGVPARAALASGGNRSYEIAITVNGAGDPYQVAQQVFAEFARQVRLRP